jgi:hypothetical protein
MGPASAAFRAQLIVPELRQIYDYWLEKCAGRRMPGRADIDPVDIPRLLHSVSLLDIDAKTGAARVRLAGTRLRDIYDREITGLAFSDIDWGDKFEYWRSAIGYTASEGKPTQGVVQGPQRDKEHLVQYWIRLPLGGEAGCNMILCYDHFRSAAENPSLHLASA